MSMSEDMLRRMQDDDRRLRQTEVKEVPPLYLPWAQRVLNPFPLASSGTTWGDQAMPWSINVLAFFCTVRVETTNNATNFWTVQLLDTIGTVVGSFTTAAIAANAFVRMSDLTITQPTSTSPRLIIVPTATLSPGAIFILPAVPLLRTGN